MATLPDLVFIGLFAIAAPLVDRLVFWPAHRRLSQTDSAWARTWLYAWTIGSQWMFAGFGVALWMANGRTLQDLGLTVPNGWRLWAAIAMVLLLAAYQAWAMRLVVRNEKHAAALRQQVSPLAFILPHTLTELKWFAGVSVTAGFCEELLYRGYFIWAFSPWIGWWGAAALSLPFFAVAHLYQGWSGFLRTGAVGALFTLIVAIFDSLWPAVAVHALVDLSTGIMAWLVFRDRPETA